MSGSVSTVLVNIEGGEGTEAIGLCLRLGERDGLRFLSRFTGDLRRGDGDRVFRLFGLLD